MNRRNFIGLLAGTVAALTLRAAKNVDEGLVSLPKPNLREYESSFESLEIAGVPVYMDPYAPEGTIYYLPERNFGFVSKSTWEQLAKDFV